MRLHFKIMLTVVPLIVAPLILLGWVTYLQLWDTSNRNLVEDLDEIAERSHDTINHVFETARSNAELVGGSYLVERFLISADGLERRELLMPELLDEFRVIRDTYPSYRELQVIRPDGLVALRIDNGGQAALEENGTVAPHLDALSASGGDVYHRVVPDPQTGRLTYFVAKPLRVSDPADDPNSPAARLRGFFAITVDLAFVEDLVRTTVLGQTGNVFLVGDDGTVLFHQDRERVGTSLVPEEAEAVRQAVISETGVVGDLWGEPLHLRAMPLLPDIQIVAVLPAADLALASTRLALMVAGAVAAAVLLISVLLFFALQRMLLGPLLQLRNAAQSIGTGHLLAPVEIRSNDELGELAGSLVEMGENLFQTQDNLFQQAQELELAREKADAANRSKSLFLAHMSHEIRTPIYGVLGMAELLSKTELEDRQRHFVEAILRSGRILKAIISDILDFSRIEAGKLDLNVESFDLRRLVVDLDDLFAERAHRMGVSLSWVLPNERSLAFRGDRGRLGQVLINLVGNALKFTEEGGVTVRVSIVDRNTDRMVLRFEVKDTGPGIEPRVQSSIFSAFAQADNSSKREHGGAGLGLAISRQLVELMDGQIGLESQAGEGSTFWFMLPLVPDEAYSETRPRDKKDGKGDDRPNDADTGLAARILLAEDNPVNQDVTSAMLQNLGCEVAVAGTGRNALEVLSGGDFDAILMDCDMPNMDGYETTYEVRLRERTGGNGRRIPIIAQTANAFRDDRERCLSVGMDDYIAKPFSQEDLRVVLGRWVNDAPEASVGHEVVEEADSAKPKGDLQTLDESALERIMALRSDGGFELLLKVVETYLEHSAQLVQEMGAAVEGRDGEGIRGGAHTLKSSSANVGAEKLASLLKRLEVAGRDMSFGMAAALYAEVKVEHTKVCEALRAELDAQMEMAQPR